MKARHILALAAAASHGAFASQAAVTFGPKNCVNLSLSPAGSCVISTNCQGVDLEHFEFAFDCTTAKNELQRHSFGMGGFDPVEEFDTDVGCTECKPPTATAAAARKVYASASASLSAGNGRALVPEATSNFALQGARVLGQAEADAAAQAIDDVMAKVVKYGPEKCVSVYKGGKHCIMKTACSKTNTTNYEFGLICVDKKGAPTRHLFGMDSFDPDETFDTLIECDQCLGLEDVSNDVALTGQVIAIGKDIKSLKTMMTDLTKDVEKLNVAVFPEQFKKNATANATAKEPANKTASSLVHQHGRKVVKKVRKVHTHHQAHRKKQRSLRHRAHRHQEAAADAVEEADEQGEDADADAEAQEVEDEPQAPKPKHHHHAAPRPQAKKVVEDKDQDEVVEEDDQAAPEAAAAAPASEEGADQDEETVADDAAAADSVQDEATEPDAAVQDDAGDADVTEDTAAAAA